MTLTAHLANTTLGAAAVQQFVAKYTGTRSFEVHAIVCQKIMFKSKQKNPFTWEIGQVHSLSTGTRVMFAVFALFRVEDLLGSSCALGAFFSKGGQ